MGWLNVTIQSENIRDDCRDFFFSLRQIVLNYRIYQKHDSYFQVDHEFVKRDLIDILSRYGLIQKSNILINIIITIIIIIMKVVGVMEMAEKTKYLDILFCPFVFKVEISLRLASFSPLYS